MFQRRLSLIIIATSCTLPSYPAIAGPLTKAEVTKIINQVSLIDPHAGERPATVQDVIKDDLGLETGKKSRSELLFQDNTLTRIGAETFFSFRTGTRDLTLEKGSMLLQVPKGLGGAKIHTAAVTAAITGTTIMMEYVPKQYIKVLVLEGSLRLSRNRGFGDSLVLNPGKMVIMRPDAKKIPDPVDVDLEHIVKTSSLVNFPGADPLPSMPLIQAAIASQQNQLVKKNLAPTNLIMRHGTNVTVALNNPLAPMISPTSTLPGTVSGATTASVKSVMASLPFVGGLISTSGSTTATTTAVNNLLGSTTGTVGTVANNVVAAASAVTSIPVSTTADNLLSSITGSVGASANSLLGTASTITSIPVSSSSQLLALANNAVPTTSATSNPTVNNTTTTVATTAGSVTSSAPSTGSTLSAATSNTAAVVTSQATTSATPPPVITTTTSAPTTLASATLATSTTSIRSLSVGH